VSTPFINIKLSEWQSQSPLPGTLLHKVFLDNHECQATAQELTKSRMLEITERREGLFIRAFSYVGHIQLGNISITVQPKLSTDTLLSLVRYAYGLRDLKVFFSATHGMSESGFQDLLVFQLLAEVKELFSRGLHRKYIVTSRRLSSPRGKIDLQNIVKQLGLAESKLPCIYYPRTLDCLTNRVLVAGLVYAARITKDSRLRTDCRKLAALLGDGVSEIVLNHNTLKRLKRENNRLTVAYKPSFSIIEIILESQGILLDQTQRSLRLPGFLFDMNRFFQALLSRFLRENMINYVLRDEYTLKGMISYLPGYNPRMRRAQSPRPDYVIQDGSRTVSILDAKYRDLWENALPREMLYQLAIYALSGTGGSKATILYPTLSQNAREAKIQISEPSYGNKLGKVILRPVNLIELEKIIMSPITPRNIRLKSKFAKTIAFGEA